MDISVKTLEIDRRGKEGLICADNIRADIKVAFFVRVNPTADDVAAHLANVSATEPFTGSRSSSSVTPSGTSSSPGWPMRSAASASSGKPGTTKTLTLEETERQHIIDVLEQTNWRVSGPKGAAAILGLKPTTLEARMKKLGIERHVKS